jgi:hypothetical protein
VRSAGVSEQCRGGRINTVACRRKGRPAPRCISVQPGKVLPPQLANPTLILRAVSSDGVLLTRFEKALRRIVGGKADTSFAFRDVCDVLRTLGFEERIRGSHHVFSHQGVPEILNLQARGGKAKAYQVRQVRDVIERYGFGKEWEDE